MLGLEKHLSDLLEGRVTPKEADPRILMWAEFHVWKMSDGICKMTDLSERREALSKIPDTIRPVVEREVKRMWKERHLRPHLIRARR